MYESYQEISKLKKKANNRTVRFRGYAGKQLSTAATNV